MLTELGFGKEFEQVTLKIVNTATLHVVGNRAFSSRTKHIALRFFYIRELVKENMQNVNWRGTRRAPLKRFYSQLKFFNFFRTNKQCSSTRSRGTRCRRKQQQQQQQ